MNLDNTPAVSPYLDKLAAEEAKHEQARAYAKSEFLDHLKAGRDVVMRSKWNGKYALSAYLTEVNAEAASKLFALCSAAMNAPDDLFARSLVEFCEACADEYADTHAECYL